MKKVFSIFLSINIKKYKNVLILLACSFLLNACSDVDFSNVPGYKTFFAPEQKVSLVKRRPAENLATYNAPPVRVEQTGPIQQSTFSSKPDGFGYVDRGSGEVKNDLGYSGSFGQRTMPPYMQRGENTLDNRNVPDFRAPFQPLDPTRTEEKSLYEGRFMSQKGAGAPIPRGKTPEQFQKELDAQEDQQRMFPPIPGPGAGSVPMQQNQLMPTSPLPQPMGQMAMADAGEDANGRRAPMLNQQVRMQLLSQYSGSVSPAPTTQNNYPNLSTVPPRPDYARERETMSEAMRQMVEERNRIANQEVIADQPIGTDKVDNSYNSALPSALPNVPVQAKEMQSNPAVTTRMDDEPVALIDNSPTPPAPTKPENNYVPDRPAPMDRFEMARTARDSELPLSMQPGYPSKKNIDETGNAIDSMIDSRRMPSQEGRPQEARPFVNPDTAPVPAPTPVYPDVTQTPEPFPGQRLDTPRSMMPTYPKTDSMDRPMRNEQFIDQPPIEITRERPMPSELPIENVPKVGIAESTVPAAPMENDIQPYRGVNLVKPPSGYGVRTLPGSRYSDVRNRGDEAQPDIFIYRQ